MYTYIYINIIPSLSSFRLAQKQTPSRSMHPGRKVGTNKHLVLRHSTRLAKRKLGRPEISQNRQENDGIWWFNKLPIYNRIKTRHFMRWSESIWSFVCCFFLRLDLGIQGIGSRENLQMCRSTKPGRYHTAVGFGFQGRIEQPGL